MRNLLNDDYKQPTEAEQEESENGGHCEDYPCCGHTPADPCTRQWYDEPGAFDTTRPGNEHALCDHENGDCNADYYDEDEDY